MRRSDKEITDRNEIDRVFREAQVCRIGLVDGERAYIVPLSYGYDPAGTGTLHFHGAKEGHKLDLMRTGMSVAFEIDHQAEIVYRDEDVACTYGTHYESLMGYGSLSFPESIDEKSAALQAIMEHYTGRDAFEMPEQAVRAVNVFSITIEAVMGKRSPGTKR